MTLTDLGCVRVLVIEDNPDDVTSLCLLLETWTEPRFQTDSAMTLKAAIPKLGAGNYDVVLLDLNLGNSKGLATLDAVRSHIQDNKPVLVRSGLSPEELDFQAVKARAADFVVKGAEVRWLILRLWKAKSDWEEDHKKSESLLLTAKQLDRVKEIESIHGESKTAADSGFVKALGKPR